MDLRNKMTNPTSLKLLIFGGTGVLGQAIAAKFKSHGYEVTYGVRKVSNPKDQFLLPITNTPVPDLLKGQLFDAIIFAQGANINDSVMNNSLDDLNKLFEANVSFITETTKSLISLNLIKHKAKMVVLSSFWEQVTRQEKMSYTITKAAVGGLVRSLAVDLGRQKKILVNGILPGIVNSPMVARTLSPEQIANVVSQTPIGELATPVDVANSVYMFGSDLNTGISGQSIFVDRGFSVARTI